MSYMYVHTHMTGNHLLNTTCIFQKNKTHHSLITPPDIPFFKKTSGNTSTAVQPPPSPPTSVQPLPTTVEPPPSPPTPKAQTAVGAPSDTSESSFMKMMMMNMLAQQQQMFMDAMMGNAHTKPAAASSCTASPSCGTAAYKLYICIYGNEEMYCMSNVCKE